MWKNSRAVTSVQMWRCRCFNFRLALSGLSDEGRTSGVSQEMTVIVIERTVMRYALISGHSGGGG